MPWASSNRRSRLPPDWPRIRAGVLRDSGGRCEVTKANGRRCWDTATAVDHIVPGDDDSRSNLQAICTYHHGVKSAQEGAAAQAAARATLTRPPEPHPGLIDPSKPLPPPPHKGF